MDEMEELSLTRKEARDLIDILLGLDTGDEDSDKVANKFAEFLDEAQGTELPNSVKLTITPSDI